MKSTIPQGYNVTSYIEDKIDEIIYILNQKYYIDCIVKYKQFKI